MDPIKFDFNKPTWNSLFLNKFDILKDLLKEKYKNRIDGNITIKNLIMLMDEVDEVYNKKIEEEREHNKKFDLGIKFNKGE